MLIKIEKSFTSREELDNHIKVTYGDNPENNKGISLELSDDDAKKFLLSEKTTIFGVKVKKI